MDCSESPSAPRTIITGGSGFIGTNLSAALLTAGHSVLAISRAEPQGSNSSADFAQADVLDSVRIENLVRDFKPTAIVHLAAATGFLTSENNLDFRTNVEGTRNVLRAAASCASVRRCVFASSYVVTLPRRPLSGRATGRAPRLYDQSKLEAERIIQTDQTLDCSWCIIRPCATWGPWFDRPYREFFLRIARGRYWHPGHADAPKRLAFVRNSCHQIIRLLEASASKIHGRIFYLGDYETTTLRDWADLIADRLGARRPRTIAEPLVRVGALAGDVLKCVGFREPPLTSFRLRNIRTKTSEVAIQDTEAVVGPLPFTRQAGVDLTIEWLRRSGLLK